MQELAERLLLLACLLAPKCCDEQVQELAEMLREVRQRLTDGERSWESEKRGLEGQLNRNLHSLHECQATADQLRLASLHTKRKSDMKCKDTQTVRVYRTFRV